MLRRNVGNSAFFLTFPHEKLLRVTTMKIRRAIFSLAVNYRYVFTSHGCLLYTFIECRVLSVLIFPDLYANGEM